MHFKKKSDLNKLNGMGCCLERIERVNYSCSIFLASIKYSAEVGYIEKTPSALYLF